MSLHASLAQTWWLGFKARALKTTPSKTEVNDPGQRASQNRVVCFSLTNVVRLTFTKRDSFSLASIVKRYPKAESEADESPVSS